MDVPWRSGQPMIGHKRSRSETGVCGTAAAENRNVVVDEVWEVDDYLASSVGSRSETRFGSERQVQNQGPERPLNALRWDGRRPWPPRLTAPAAGCWTADDGRAAGAAKELGDPRSAPAVEIASTPRDAATSSPPPRAKCSSSATPCTPETSRPP